MGNTSYDLSSRSARSDHMGWSTKSVDETFTQQRERRVHESMDSRKVDFREARDSKLHPNTVPIILALDVTGSMGSIPHHLIKEGLPTLMSKLIQNGCPDATLCFIAVGDHECDKYPLQISQFESGDAELDMWLTRTYLEGGGGGNAGESYPLAWQFAANRVKTDAWDKRKQKGFVITIGDEPFLKQFPSSSMKEIYTESTQQGTVTAQQFHADASEKFNCFHISVEHGSRNYTDPNWKQLMGENLKVTSDYTKIPDIIADIILSKLPIQQLFGEVAEKKEEEKVIEPIQML